MAENVLSFELVSPERLVAARETDAVTIPGMEGDLTAMVNHAPFLSTLRPGFVVIRDGAKEERYFVTGGFAEIFENTVSILADNAVNADEVDQVWLDEHIADAQKSLEQAPAERKRAAQQQLNDFIALKNVI